MLTLYQMTKFKTGKISKHLQTTNKECLMIEILIRIIVENIAGKVDNISYLLTSIFSFSQIFPKGSFLKVIKSKHCLEIRVSKKEITKGGNSQTGC